MRDTEKILIVIQARVASTRLPGKVLLPILGKPLLLHMAERVKATHVANDIVVATTTNAEDTIIAELCAAANIKCFRGHPTDLLDRHYRAGLAFNADIVAKIPSDCPLIDPRIIDRTLNYFRLYRDDFDFVSNLHPATYPDGNDVEVMSMAALESAWYYAKKPFQREHTTPFIWDNPEWFRIGNLAWESGMNYSMTHRWTLDYEEDYQFIRTVFERLYPNNPLFSMKDILTLLWSEPEIGLINNSYAGVNWYHKHLNDLRTVTPEETRELFRQANIGFA